MQSGVVDAHAVRKQFRELSASTISTLFAIFLQRPYFFGPCRVAVCLVAVQQVCCALLSGLSLTKLRCAHSLLTTMHKYHDLFSLFQGCSHLSVCMHIHLLFCLNSALFCDANEGRVQGYWPVLRSEVK